MLRAFYSSATGMRAQELLIDNTANNIANVNTNGFKRSQLDFADLIYATSKPPGANAGGGQNAPTGVQIGSGVRPVGTTKIFSNGVMQATENNTDVAIEGSGFFKVTVNGVEKYTRDGSFRVNANGDLVNGDGFLLTAGINIPTDVPHSQISISEDGQVSANVGSSTLPLGQIPVYLFRNPAGLSSEGSNLYAVTPASGTATEATPGTLGAGSLRSGFLEKSNVEVVHELVSLITAQRAYEFNSRAIRAGDEMLSTTSQIIR